MPKGWIRIQGMDEKSSRLEKIIKTGTMVLAIISLVLSFAVTIYLKFNK
jgi:hypothetical protein